MDLGLAAAYLLVEAIIYCGPKKGIWSGIAYDTLGGFTMFNEKANEMYAIMAYESCTSSGHKLTDWMNWTQARDAWIQFKQKVMAEAEQGVDIIDSKYSLTIRTEGSMTTYAIEPWF